MIKPHGEITDAIAVNRSSGGQRMRHVTAVAPRMRPIKVTLHCQKAVRFGGTFAASGTAAFPNRLTKHRAARRFDQSAPKVNHPSPTRSAGYRA